MRTSREPRREPTANQKSKTRGVRYIERPGRENPYGVQWPEKIWDPLKKALVRKVKTLFFPTKEAREEKASELRDARRSRMVVASTSRDELDQWRAFQAATQGTPWQEVVAGWKSWQIGTGNVTCTLTVETAAKEYVAHSEALEKRQKLSADYLRHIKKKVGLFVEQFGDLTMDKVPTAEIVSWIDDFGHESDYTFDNYKTHVVTFYNFFIKRPDAPLKVNPAQFIKDRSDGIGEVKIISVAQTAQLFWTALNYVDGDGRKRFLPIIGRLALEAFIGLRFASGCRIEKRDINFEDRGVTLPKRKLKTKRRHYIDGLPENLWAWLEVTPDECWELTPRLYMRLKSQLFEVANVPHPHNCLRHGFATYHVAAYKNGANTAYILCHRDQDELYEHYKGNATEAQGKLFQTITPATVDDLRQGFQPARDEGDTTPRVAPSRSPASLRTSSALSDGGGREDRGPILLESAAT